MKNLIRCSMLGASVLGMTACGMIYAPTPSARGHVVLSGDGPGVRSLFDGMNGFITNGKATPDHDTSHWANRRAEERQLTIREFAPGWLSGLFAPKPQAQTDSSAQEGK